MFKEADIVNAYKEFKKANSTRKKIQIAENVYIDFKRGKRGDITASLFLRSTYIKKFFNKNILTIDRIEFYYNKNKNLKIKNFDDLLKKVKKIKEEINGFINKNTGKKINKINEYKDDFFKNLEKRKIKKETIKRHKRRFEKVVIPFFKNRDLELITKETLVDFCNFVLENLKYKGASVKRSKSGCDSIAEMISLLRLFYRFLLSKNIIKEEVANIIENFNYKKYFDFCKTQNKNIALQHFKNLNEAREFYALLQEIKEEINIYFENEDKADKEYLAKLLNYKHRKLLNTYRLNSFLHRILITEFLMLTAIRSIDFFKIKENSIRIDENNVKYIYFESTKNNEEYTLYLTDYLLDLYMQIRQTKGDCYKNEERKQYLTCITQQSFRNFVNEFFVGYNNININVHGFRHTMKTLSEEYLNFSRNVIEAQLQHKYKEIDTHYLQSDLKHKRLELLEQYRTLLSNKEYSFMYDRKGTLKREFFKFLEDINIKYNASLDEIEKIISEIKTNSFKDVDLKKEDSMKRKEELLKKFLDSI